MTVRDTKTVRGVIPTHPLYQLEGAQIVDVVPWKDDENGDLLWCLTFTTTTENVEGHLIVNEREVRFGHA